MADVTCPRVLDLDLDLFLEDCCPLAEPGERPEAAGHMPWPVGEVERFLEENCGLSAASPVPGRIFETHDRALDLWLECLDSNRLTAPFEVVHADAHSDLGIGYPGPAFVLHHVASRPPAERIQPALYRQAQKLDEANYLLFALAFRHVSSLVNIRNPRSRADFPRELATDEEGVIRVQSLTAQIFESRNGPEPPIRYREYIDPFTYHAPGPFDLVSLALSPRYAPREADSLAEIIRRYIRPI